jgi:hypothetical protein
MVMHLNTSCEQSVIKTIVICDLIILKNLDLIENEHQYTFRHKVHTTKQVKGPTDDGDNASPSSKGISCAREHLLEVYGCGISYCVPRI